MLRERAKRQPTEGEAQVLPERVGCDEGADPAAGATPAEPRALQGSTRPRPHLGRGHAQQQKEVEKYTLENIPRDLFFEAKQKGYADCQVAHLLGCLESEVYKKRNDLGIKRVYKLVDTCAGEFPAKTPYYYSTFEEENESIPSDKKKIVVLGSGPNRIGQGIEFDYCCVHGVLAAKEMVTRPS